MSDALLDGYLIKIIFLDANPQKEIKFLQNLGDKTSHINYINKNHLYADNSNISLYIITKLINLYDPLIWVYELTEFMEFKIPKWIRKIAHNNEDFYSDSIINQIDKISSKK